MLLQVVYTKQFSTSTADIVSRKKLFDRPFFCESGGGSYNEKSRT